MKKRMVQLEEVLENTSNNTKAVIFSHFGSLNRLAADEITNQMNLNYYSELLENFIQCNKNKKLISIVYIYIDWAVRKVLPDLKIEKGGFNIHNKFLDWENDLKGVLETAERKVFQKNICPHSHRPKFFFIGLSEINKLLSNLIEADPEMPSFLCGNQGKFTYDSPKFIESIIRLSRGDCGHLASFPIIRVDEDAIPNEKCLESLINAYQTESVSKPFFFFSGRYGRENRIYDPINDFAVRTHWFFPPGTKAGSTYSKNDIDKAETFLADLELLGAKQPVDHGYSTNLRKLIEKGDIPKLEKGSRVCAQVISGAGLIMSRRNINLLPPFMNLNQMTSWIDDHLKRKLHEALNDILHFDLEVVPSIDAIFQQEREPNPLTVKFIEEFSSEYFERLLRGCLFSALISDQNGKVTKYSEKIMDLVWYRKNKRNSDKNIKLELSKILVKRFDNVLYCWSSHEFMNTELSRWVENKKNDPDYKDKLCGNLRTEVGIHGKEVIVGIDGEVLKDAFAYLTLLENWHIFTRAIERLSFINNHWLFFNEDLT